MDLRTRGEASALQTAVERTFATRSKSGTSLAVDGGMQGLRLRPVQ
ncbi:hypothetical protein [Arthrobacter sp. StoSoilB5]|nr:hypothetical protein [Arthrobacter sp. StoSoilB5]